ncbi:hypothetical protein [Microvirga brassicacearum]|nr:hypothetical protein [Microvirga brassicacearum]
MPARDLARCCGASEQRAIDWLSGKEDIPPHIDLLTRLWLKFEPAMDETDAWVDEVCRDQRREG